MKHYISLALLLFALLLNSGASFGQSQILQKVRKNVNKPLVHKEILKPYARPAARTGLEAITSVTPAVPVAPRNGFVAEVAGESQYDLQTNGCESPHLNIWADGKITAAWTLSTQADGSGWPDRGSAYNDRLNGDWGAYPTARIESVRTGFTNYLVTENGTEFVIAHRTANNIYYPRISVRAANAVSWTESDIASTAPNGCLWYKAAADGNNIYVIGLTAPSTGGIGGTNYKGLNGHVLFFRSKNAGVNWDIVDGIIPGLDSTAYAEIGSDSYTIAARDGIVAVGVFDSWNDAKLFKSTDGGDTWDQPVTIFDFPLEKYTHDKGYTVDDIPLDPDAPDPLAIFSTDGCGSLAIDLAGVVHAWVGETYVLDTDLSDDNSSYYPGINGLIYWNDLLPDELTEITASFDWNGNDTLDITSIIGMGCGLSSMPAGAASDDGSLFLAYSANVENLSDFNENNLRHVYVMKSEDLGQTWDSEPIDVQYATDTEPDSLVSKVTEAVWPSVYKNATNGFHFLFQSDYEAGSSVQQTGIQGGLSEIIYVDGGNLVGLKKVPSEKQLDVSISPNPSSEYAIMTFSLKQADEVGVAVFNMAGQMVQSLPQGKMQPGIQNLHFNTTTLSSGLYFVRVSGANASGQAKLLVAK